MRQAGRADVRIGISGWRYASWRGVFYPRGLVQKRELEHASRVFRTIEINGSFYSLQRPSSYACWRDETPAGFVFSVKGAASSRTTRSSATARGRSRQLLTTWDRWKYPRRAS